MHIEKGTDAVASAVRVVQAVIPQGHAREGLGRHSKKEEEDRADENGAIIHYKREEEIIAEKINKEKK